MDTVTIHGFCRDGGRHRISTIHSHMLSRCNNHDDDNYKYYGGRGVSVCDEWLDIQKFANWAFDNGYGDE